MRMSPLQMLAASPTCNRWPMLMDANAAVTISMGCTAFRAMQSRRHGVAHIRFGGACWYARVTPIAIAS